MTLKSPQHLVPLPKGVTRLLARLHALCQNPTQVPFGCTLLKLAQCIMSKTLYLGHNECPRYTYQQL